MHAERSVVLRVSEQLYLLYSLFLERFGELFELTSELRRKGNIHRLRTEENVTNVSAENFTFTYFTLSSKNSVYCFFFGEPLKCTAHDISAI